MTGVGLRQRDLANHDYLAERGFIKSLIYNQGGRRTCLKSAPTPPLLIQSHLSTHSFFHLNHNRVQIPPLQHLQRREKKKKKRKKKEKNPHS